MIYIEQLSSPHCTVVEIKYPCVGSFYAISCYFQWQDDIQIHLATLSRVLDVLKGKRVLISADSNAWSVLWGSKETNNRGFRLQDFIESKNLSIANVAECGRWIPTFANSRGTSHIDVTLATSPMAKFIKGWRVRTNLSSSDHRVIDIEVGIPQASAIGELATSKRFCTKKADWGRFTKALRELVTRKVTTTEPRNPHDCEQMAEDVTAVIIESCEHSMPRRKIFKKSNPWWTKHFSALKKLVVRCRNLCRRAGNEESCRSMKATYRETLRKYKKEIRIAKRESWRKFVTDSGNETPWSYVYRQQAGKLKTEKILSTVRFGDRQTLSKEETAKVLLETHVPDDLMRNETEEQGDIRAWSLLPPETNDADSFEIEEIIKCARSFRNNSAPGADLVEAVVLKTAVFTIPRTFQILFNACLKHGVFPRVWKIGNLRIIPKGANKDQTDPKSYRPICLLSVVGKLFEKLLKSRLEEYVLTSEKMSARQFGFTSKKSTEDAIVELRRLVAESEERHVAGLLFDIKGAFDNVWWPLILDNLKKKECPKNIYKVMQSYFSDRTVRITWGDNIVEKNATKGCPQGSVLGPTFWNVQFDELLVLLAEILGEDLVAYADDLLVLIKGSSRPVLQEKGQMVVNAISKWCKHAKLELSESKTEGIVFRAKRQRTNGCRTANLGKTSKKLKVIYPTIKIGETKIAFKDTVKYLGIHFDKGLQVHSHCEYLVSKVTSTFRGLRAMVGATWGLKFKTCSVLYRGVFIPTVAYAAYGWSDLCTVKDLNKLKTAQRQALLTVVKTYKTASTDALCVLAGELPIKTLLKRSRARYEIRIGRSANIADAEIRTTDDKEQALAEIDKMVLREWQAEWDSSEKGRFTHKFLPSVKVRREQEWFLPDFFAAQVLTGHGDFGDYHVRFSHKEEGSCSCGSENESAEHLLLRCPRWNADRTKLRNLLGQDVEKVQELSAFVSSPEVYAAFALFCRTVLQVKSREQLT